MTSVLARMKPGFPIPLICMSLVLTTGWLPAGDFESIFDGNSLKGWQAPIMSDWSVEDGAITGQSTRENPCTSNQFLVWQGGDVADFELKLKLTARSGCAEQWRGGLPLGR